MSLPPFPAGYRASGVLLHVTSLPSPYGIGDVGPTAMAWIGTGAEVAAALLRLAWSSVAALAIAPLQDVLNLGKEARMNQPGSAQGNWRWRVTNEMLSGSALESLRTLTQASARADVVMAARS